MPSWALEQWPGWIHIQPYRVPWISRNPMHCSGIGAGNLEKWKEQKAAVMMTAVRWLHTLVTYRMKLNWDGRSCRSGIVISWYWVAGFVDCKVSTFGIKKQRLFVYLEESWVSPNLATDPEPSAKTEEKACRNEDGLLASFWALVAPLLIYPMSTHKQQALRFEL